MSLENFKNQLDTLNKEYNVTKNAKKVLNTGENFIKNANDNFTNNKFNKLASNTMYFILLCVTLFGLIGIIDVLSTGRSSFVYVSTTALISYILTLLGGGSLLIVLDINQIRSKKINLFMYLIFLIPIIIFNMVANYYYVGILSRLILSLIITSVAYRLVYFIMLIISHLSGSKDILVKSSSFISNLFKVISNSFIGKNK